MMNVLSVITKFLVTKLVVLVRLGTFTILPHTALRENDLQCTKRIFLLIQVNLQSKCASQKQLTGASMTRESV